MDETSNYQSFVRAFRYYGASEAQRIGNSLHSDWNLLTLVWTDRPGLEVLHEGQYHNLHPDDDFALICNYGDYLSSMMGGKVKSPWHRVILPEEGVRNSLVYFFYPKDD